MIDVEQRLAEAVRLFWQVREKQKKRHEKEGAKDVGNRGAVTGGKHADGFIALIAEIVRNAGIADAKIRIARKTEKTLPGFFRPTKEWDVVVLDGRCLLAVIEIKSQVGSFGNNFNNRVEEAVGSATDFWIAYREGMFSPSPRPWLGYFFMLEAHPASLRPTKRVHLHPFAMDETFQGVSYVERYQRVCLRLLRERLYDAACFFTSNREDGVFGRYYEPDQELGIRRFAASLYSHVIAYAKMKE